MKQRNLSIITDEPFSKLHLGNLPLIMNMLTKHFSYCLMPLVISDFHSEMTAELGKGFMNHQHESRISSAASFVQQSPALTGSGRAKLLESTK
jgi:hypothetical protein